jgi:hypothetical protein
MRLSWLTLLLLSFVLASCGSPAPRTYNYQFTPGKTVILRGRYALVPTNAPEVVKRAVAAGNRLQGKPYIYGGGHRSFQDRGYDCSGTASYVMHYAGFLRSPIPSDAFRSFGQAGPGKWITIYAKRGHVFTVVGGLRLDTGYNGQGEGPQWSTKSRPAKGYVMRHPPGY